VESHFLVALLKSVIVGLHFFAALLKSAIVQKNDRTFSKCANTQPCSKCSFYLIYHNFSVVYLYRYGIGKQYIVYPLWIKDKQLQ